MQENQTSSLGLQPMGDNDNIKVGCKDKIKKGTMSEKRKNIKISKKRTATLRKDGRWQVYAKVDGKRIPCYGRTEYLANCKADQEEAKCREDDESLRMLIGEDKYLFGNCFYRYRNYLLFYTNRTGGTVDRYEQTYKRYFPDTILNSLDIRKLDSVDVSNFLITVLKKYDKLTTKEWQRIKHIIKSTIDFVYDEEIDDVAEPIDWGKIKKKATEQGKIYKSVKQQYAVTLPEKQILQDKILKDNIYPEKFAHVLMLLINFSLGLRVGELAALKVDDIDMEKHVVYVNDSCKCYKKRDEYGNAVGGYVHVEGATKTPKGKRYVPMSYNAQQMFAILLEYRKEKGYTDSHLAYDGEEEKSRAKSMGKILKRLCSKSEIDDFTTHIIRKTFATMLSKCPDIDIATISEYLGHAQVSTTVNNYLIPARDTIDDKIEKISKCV